MGALLEQAIRHKPTVEPRTREGRRMPMGEVVVIRLAVPPYILQVEAGHNLLQSWSALEPSPLTWLRGVRRMDHILRMEDAVEIPCQHDGPAVSWKRWVKLLCKEPCPLVRLSRSIGADEGGRATIEKPFQN